VYAPLQVLQSCLKAPALYLAMTKQTAPKLELNELLPFVGHAYYMHDGPCTAAWQNMLHVMLIEAGRTCAMLGFFKLIIASYRCCLTVVEVCWL